MAARSICTCFLLVSLHFARAQDQEPSVRNTDNPSSSSTPFSDYGEYIIYPDNSSPQQYFNNKLDFETIDGNILIGAADKLYLLNKDLSVADELNLPPNNTVSCDTTTNTEEYVCRNHIRVYEELPSVEGGARSLLVCGTQSNTPDCRTVEITSTPGFGNLGNVSSNVEGLISAHPDLPGFGEFRRSTPEDSVYFAASFTSSNTRQYDLAYLNVSVDQAPSAQKLYGYLRTSSLWLNFPVVFVDYRRESYPPPEGSTNEAAYHFYFVFLRENFQVDNREVLYSRVVRICRNDPGITSSQGSEIFSTFLKARIFCFREMPPGTEFVGAQDFEFNEIWSLSFNSDQGGRYYADGGYNRLMYGAFSGPLIGPPGTAICVYPAYPAAGQDSLNNGIFDIFQGDVAITDPGTGPNPQTERQNMFVECAPQGRNMSGEAEDIQIIKDIKQLGDNPLLILDGLHVTQMVVDEVCAVKRSDPTVCLNQDVLFLGTDTGVVYKVVLATVTEGTSSGAIEPVIVDEIQLEDTDEVREMKLESVGADKFLYVSTAARIYRLPLENCARHGTDFNACVGSRDPYCVWDSVDVTCKRSSLTAAGGAEGTVPSAVRQNIHTGQDTVPEVTLTEGEMVINEGQSPLSVVMTTNSRVSNGVLQLVTMDGTARAGVDYSRPSEPVNFPVDQNRAVVDIPIIQRSGFTGNLRFTIGLKSSGSGALNFGISTATVTIVDEQGLLVQLALGGLGTQTCQEWILFDRQNKLNAVSNAVLNSFIPSAKLEDFSDTFVNTTFSCTDGLSADRQEFTVFRATIDTTKLSATRDGLISSLENWIKDTPNVNDRGNVYTVLTDSNCETIILSLDDPLCAYNGVMVGNAGAVGPEASTGTVNALAVLFAVAVVVIVVLVVVLVFVVVFRRREKCHQPNEVADSGVGLKKVVCTNKKDLGDGSEEGSTEHNPQTPTTATGLLRAQFDFSTASNGHKDTQTANVHSDAL